MMPDRILPIFRDDEKVVLDGLDDLFPEGDPDHLGGKGDETPYDLEAKVPFVRISRIGGSSQDNITDRPVIDVDVYALTRAQAKRIAQRVEQWMASCRHPIDFCNVLIAPMKVEWAQGESKIRRFYASYQLGLRR